ncbi:tripartite tricarboxylate transporter substrate binding protein [Ramlibacter sp. AW1]|uniref:Tripartite tricarboxylate transporter substrate binding protein n=1 Tax=Ramlibacter aurantiacus TaxID=2801330 RepID=A0A936ZR07_9BURK|nr:tripartite tricarboxylate transporter substrate-binding protein [Ramlibacter aurantiacus]MBL0421893.1 tripartite tricarboxylate transporter substrate binding protein [Ramlibacter aurantiacus]
MQITKPSAVTRLSCVVFCALLGATAAAQAQAPASYPSKQVDITVPFAPGGGVDLLARLIAQPLGVASNQNVIVENRPGASGTIAARHVAGRPADGHSLLMMNDTYAIVAAASKKLPFDAKKDIAPVLIVAYAPQLLVTSPQSPLRTFGDVLKAGKAKDAKLSYGACGAGTPGHLGAESLNLEFDMNILHIPYKGCGPTMVDVMGGGLDMAWVTLGAAVPHVKAGKLRAIAVSAKERSLALPDVPTVAESGAPGFNFSSWQAVGVPGGTPENVKTQVYAAIARILKTDAMQKRLTELGYTPANLDDTPRAVNQVVDGDIDKFTTLTRRINFAMD